MARAFATSPSIAVPCYQNGDAEQTGQYLVMEAMIPGIYRLTQQ